MNTWYVKRNDTYGNVTEQLLDENLAPVNITGASVKFSMRTRTGSVAKVSSAATIVTAATGIVKYQWVTGDTDTAGDYRAEWQVTFSSGKIQTYPNNGYDTISILQDLA
ncbi:Domain of unknown function DUF2479 [uncultured Caudovirales phage]|uniref:Uncharacterized protein n=1 Tax=uncultured Caudovirales phage TaxID=2100421 RepID=A0A6J5Q923_9CAUD|nr:Domain of unknown function DUF2479 [uncultured Caudovirales phage]